MASRSEGGCGALLPVAKPKGYVTTVSDHGGAADGDGADDRIGRSGCIRGGG